VVLIGDAVLATTPHLAAGACIGIGIEDAIVLAEELCRMVVENSARLGKVEITN
jgi:2-polyprenyl-6-methoxyphenol hydroxylase-like FAD-dependent oxidoreductase